MRHVRETNPSIDFFKDSIFSDFHKTLDGEMKRIPSTGTGTKKKQAELITPDEEEKLWSLGTLGDHSLLNTIFTCVEYTLLYKADRNIINYDTAPAKWKW